MKAYTRTENPTVWNIRDNVVDIKAQGWNGQIEGPNGWHKDSMYIVLPELQPGDLVSVFVRGQHLHLFGSQGRIVIRTVEKVRLSLRDVTDSETP